VKGTRSLGILEVHRGRSELRTLSRRRRYAGIDVGVLTDWRVGKNQRRGHGWGIARAVSLSIQGGDHLVEVHVLVVIDIRHFVLIRLSNGWKPIGVPGREYA